jgi:hypothetical protein
LFSAEAPDALRLRDCGNQGSQNNKTTDKQNPMKKLLVALCFMCALALAAHAEDEGKEKKATTKRANPTTEQKAYRKTLTEKYDANKNGKLDADEREKITDEEREKAGYAPKKEKKEKKEKKAE